jgi:hypothetical protein
VPGAFTPAWPLTSGLPPSVPLQFVFGSPMLQWLISDAPEAAWLFGAPLVQESFGGPATVP